MTFLKEQNQLTDLKNKAMDPNRRWEAAQDFGFIEINTNNSISLYFDRNYALTCPSPHCNLVVESARWQGNSVVINGHNQYGETEVHVLRGQFDSTRIR